MHILREHQWVHIGLIFLVGCLYRSPSLTLSRRVCLLNKQEKETDSIDTSVEMTAAAKVSDEVNISCGEYVRV